MKKILIAALLAFLPGVVLAQVVTQLPVYVNNNLGAVQDMGNGPLEIRMFQGSAQVFTSQGSGVGSTSGSSTALTLTATPATPPCVGCIINGGVITSGNLVTSYNGGLTVGLTTAVNVPSGTALAWGAACPANVGSQPVAQYQAGVGADLPLYTQSRICLGAQFGVGAVVFPFPLGAH